MRKVKSLHRDRGDDPHLRSCRAIERYHLHATDGDIGHVESLLVDDEAWAIRYLVVNTSDWWLGHQTLVAPPWITDISWLDATVSVDLTRQAVKDAPTYDGKVLPNREQERSLFDHYGHPNRDDASVAPYIDVGVRVQQNLHCSVEGCCERAGGWFCHLSACARGSLPTRPGCAQGSEVSVRWRTAARPTACKP